MSEFLNPKMVTLARESRALTQTALAEAMGIAQATLSKIEQGISEAPEDFPDRLSKVLDYPRSFFCQPGATMSSGLVFHRKRYSLHMRTRAKVEAEVTLRLIQLQHLLQSVEIDSDIPNLDLAAHSHDPRNVARALRYHWRVPRGPIKDLTQLLEKKGIVILPCNFDTNLLDGFFMHETPPVIALNMCFTWDRLRFTMAHELGHLVMHDMVTDDVEREANDFASEFLMPEEHILPELQSTGRIDLSSFADFKRVWGVSMAALIMRATDVGVISSHQKKRLMIQMGQLGYRKREPASLDVAPEHPCLVRKMVDVHLNELNYSEEELAALLCLHVDEFRALYMDRPRLLTKMRIQL